MVSRVSWFRGFSGFIGFVVSWFRGFMVSRVSRFHGFHGLKGFVVSMFHDFTGFMVSWFSCFTGFRHGFNGFVVLRVSVLIDNLKKYSYQYQSNIKLVGVLEIHGNESSDHTGNLCFKLFQAIGATSAVSPCETSIYCPCTGFYKANDQHKSIICKLVRRLAKEEVMQHQQKRANISRSYDQLLSAKLHLLVSLNMHSDTNIAGPRIFKTFLESSKNIKGN